MPHLAWLYIGEKFLRKAIANNARLLVVETIVPDTSAAAFSKLLDINMMKI